MSNDTAADDDYLYGGDDDDDYVWPTSYSHGASASCLVSVIGSAVILREVWAAHRTGPTSSRRSNRGRRNGNNAGLPILRALASLSVADIFYSVSKAFGTVPSPSHLDYIENNVGNTATCTAQGFFLTIGVIGAPFFNVVLSYFYLLMVNFNWKDHQVHKIEWPSPE